MTLLQQRDRARQERRIKCYEATRRRLRKALADLVPGQRVILFGSLTQSGRFNDCSDVDLALLTEPPSLSIFSLISMLQERLGRSVDVVLLEKSRLKDKILREGEQWTA